MNVNLIIGLVAALALLGLIVYQLTRKREQSRLQTMAANPSRPISMGAKHNWLVVYDAQGQPELTYHIGDRTVTLGRGVSNYIQVTDNNASRVHCQFTPTRAGLQVKDMSNNGTFVGDEKVMGAVTLVDGDTVQVGDRVFTYLARGSFATNHGLLQAKAPGAISREATSIEGIRSMPEMLRSALEAADNDVEQAAANLGMSAERFRALCKAQRIHLS